MNPKTIKLIGMGLSVLGTLVKLGVEIVADKKLDMKIDNKVTEAFNNFNK